jgi:hypothetical protein
MQLHIQGTSPDSYNYKRSDVAHMKQQQWNLNALGVRLFFCSHNSQQQ